MLDRIWIAMLIAGLAAGIAGGRGDRLAQELITSSREAVDLCISLAGTLCFWTGIMRIMERVGMARNISRLLHPLLRFLFPGVPKGHPAMGAIGMSLSANLLGLGNAATPLGIHAMKELSSLRADALLPDNTASDDMCMFIVMNTSGFTLIPTTILAMRSAANSADVSGILLPIWICSLFSLVFGVFMTKLLSRMPLWKLKSGSSGPHVRKDAVHESA
ncbi:MAG TPA: nucleoside recognition protein [Clostridiales bacterium]|nr:nucleoside recognition protein [Clostridiales bacterium]